MNVARKIIMGACGSRQWLCGLAILLVLLMGGSLSFAEEAPPSSNNASATEQTQTAPVDVSTEALKPKQAKSEPAKTQASDKRTLDARVQALKKEVKALNRDLFILEEELLFPSSTQMAIFLSIDVGDFFRLDSVQLKIDGKVVSNHLYTKRELNALKQGGVQRLYIGNVKTGEHELIASFRGPGPNNREYKRGTSIKFEKGSGVKYMELKIHDVTKKLQPEFVVKEWE